MADPTKYTIEQVIALPKGTTPWYEQNQDAYRHIKNTMDVVADISGGGEPGFGSPIDIRHYVMDISGSNVNYKGVTRPAATSQDSLVIGLSLMLDVESPNAGACTIDLGTKEGPVSIKQYAADNSKADPVPGAIIGPTLIAFDGYQWVLDKSALPGATGPEGPDGPAGTGLYMKGSVATVGDLPAGASVGDAYLVQADSHLYVWADSDVWLDLGSVAGLDPPYDLSENEIGDLKNVAATAAAVDQVLSWTGTEWIGNKVNTGMILDGTIAEEDYAANSVSNRALDSVSDFSPGGTWSFGKPIVGDGSLLTNVPAANDLANKNTWLWGQYNEIYFPTNTGNTPVDRTNAWSAEQYPVSRLTIPEAQGLIVSCLAPTVEGMYMTIILPANFLYIANELVMAEPIPEVGGVDLHVVYRSYQGLWVLA